MIRVGITGQSGFVGNYLYNELALHSDVIERIYFEDKYFQEQENLRKFVKQCDVIVHLAAVNRDENQKRLYETNIGLVRYLIDAMEQEGVKPYLLFSSSIQEDCDNLYGKSKREGRALLETWARQNGASFTGMLVPNVYGPFGRPYYNSFVATFCHQLVHGEKPEIIQDNQVKLIYIGSLCDCIINKILERSQASEQWIEEQRIPHDFEKKVSEILAILENFKDYYYDKGIIPAFRNQHELNIFHTFSGYLDMKSHFPVKLKMHSDHRGYFVETLKAGSEGQISFSLTAPGITRGNHYHTRKLERFVVLKGKALIRLRQIGRQEILEYELDGAQPAYIDIPIWYTHNITNIGKEDLYTQFWISEWYNPQDGDTFLEMV